MSQRGARLRLAVSLLLALGGLAAGFARSHAQSGPRSGAARTTPKERSVFSEDGDAPVLAEPSGLSRRVFASEGAAKSGTRERLGAEQLEHLLQEREGWVRARREAAIVELERFVKTEPEAAAEMPDALLRLAELRWEQARARYVADYHAWQAAPKNVRADKPPAADIARALELYDRILTRHRGFPRYDLVLYMKAYALLEASRMTEALTVYKRIIDEFPQSRFRPDAHMAFAEWHFSGSYDYQVALVEYEAVLRYPESELSDIALFKSAWCLWKLGKVTEAATRFRQVLDLGGKLAQVSGERKHRLLELQDEALEYLIQVFTEDEKNTAADLHRFLLGIGGEQYAERVLKRLSRAFFDQARYPRAIEAYQMLLASQPMDPAAPTYQRQIAAAHDALDDSDATVRALTTLAEAYGPAGAWAKAQPDPETVARAERSAERAVRTQAMRYHERAQKEKQAEQFARAAALYRVHLTHFGKHPASYEVSFYLAEILFHRQDRAEEAGDFYVRAARQNPAGPLTKDALYNAVLAFESVRVKELAGCKKGGAGPAAPPAAAVSGGGPAPAADGATHAAPAQPADPCSETPTDHKFSEAIALYVQLFPQDPEVPGILFRQGRMYFERGIYDPAIRQFGQLLESYPKNEYATTAGELVLESFNRARDYANIERWARTLKSAPAFQNAESQRKLDVLILQAVFKSGEQLAARGEHRAAALAYLRAADEFPRDERTPKAHYNAGQEWQRAGNLEAAAGAYDALIERHPGTAEGALAAWAAAQMFESIAQFRDAARYYEAYARRFPKADKRDDALHDAIVLRIAAGDGDEAVEDGKLFLQAFPSGALTDEVHFLVGRAHEKKQRWAQAAETYKHYLRVGRNADRKVEANTRLGQVLLAQGDRAGADRAWAAAIKLGKKSDSGTARYFAAQARFLQGDQVLAEFEKIKIAGDMRGLRKRLDQKSELLRKAAEAYSEVVELRVAEWLTAALYKIGQSYELFADALRDAPVPEGLAEVEAQAYRDELAKFIVPIEERALEAYESGYRKAIELRVFNRWTAKQREALTRLNDIEYPPLREAGAELAETEVLPPPAPFEGLKRSLPAANGGGAKVAHASPSAQKQGGGR